MKRFLLTLLLACTIGVAGAWADSYTIEFLAQGTGDGSEFSEPVTISNIVTKNSIPAISSVTEISKAYSQGKNGLKLGTSKLTGKVTFNIAEAYQVKATKVIFNIASYNTSDKSSLKVTVGSKSATYSLTSTSLSDNSMILDGTEPITSIKLETTTKRAWVKSITVEYTPEPSGPVAVTPVFSPLEAEQNTLFTLSAEPADFIADVTNLEFASNDILMEVVNGEIQGIAAEFTGDYEVNVSWGEGTKYAAGSTSFTFTVTAPQPPVAPVFTPAPGTYEMGTQVSLTAEEGAEIYWGFGFAEDQIDNLDLYNGVPLSTDFPCDLYLAAYSSKNGLDSEWVYAHYTFTLKQPEFGFVADAFTVEMGSTTLPELNNPENVAYTFTSSDPEVIMVSPSNSQELWYIKPGNATITAHFKGNETFGAKDVSCIVTVKPEGEPIPATDTFDFGTKDYGMTGLSGTTSEYNETETNKSISFSEGDVTITTDKGSGSGTRLWYGTDPHEFRVYKNSSITITVTSGYTLNSVSWFDNRNNETKLSPSNNKVILAPTGTTRITKIIVYYSKPAAPAHDSLGLFFGGETREALVNDEGYVITPFEGAELTAGAEATIGYLVLNADGSIVDNIAIGEIDEYGLSVLTESDSYGDYKVLAYVAPSEKYYPAIATIDLKVRHYLTPLKLYMHGHFADRYYDIMRPIVMANAGNKHFKAEGVYIGGNPNVEEGDFGYVFTSHVPAGADLSDDHGDRARVAAHATTWADHTEGVVYDANGIKEASSVNSQEDLTTIKPGGAGIYNIDADFTDPENPVFTADFTGAITTGIENVNVEANAAVEYYNLQGVRVANPDKGVYLRRAGNTVTKVIL